jgi:hypothetical protein
VFRADLHRGSILLLTDGRLALADGPADQGRWPLPRPVSAASR